MRILVSHLQLQKRWKFNTHVFIKDQVNSVIKGSRAESIEDAKKEYKLLFEEGWRKLRYLKVIFDECKQFVCQNT